MPNLELGTGTAKDQSVNVPSTNVSPKIKKIFKVKASVLESKIRLYIPPREKDLRNQLMSAIKTTSGGYATFESIEEIKEILPIKYSTFRSELPEAYPKEE